MGAKFLRSYDDVSAKMTPHPHRFFSFPGIKDASPLPPKDIGQKNVFPPKNVFPVASSSPKVKSSWGADDETMGSEQRMGRESRLDG